MPHVFAPWRRRRPLPQQQLRARAPRRPVAMPEPLESRVLLCADHAGGPEELAAVKVGATKPVLYAEPLTTSEDLAGGGQAVLPAGFTEQQIAAGMTSPTAIEVAPDGRVFVSEQTGNIRVIKNGQLLATPFVTVTEDSYFERGLFGVAFDPNFATNRFVYVFYTALLPGRAAGAAENPHRVSRFTADPANLDRALAGSEVILYETPGVGTAMWHSGGAIDFGPDGKLYFTVGDVQIPSASQSLTSPFGKVHRINPDGTIPTDNPFYNQTTGTNRSIWAMGLRNPFTAAFQPGTGRYYVNDVGQASWEEINEGFAGANFGWPGTEGAFDPNQHLNYTNPTYTYGHNQGCSISGGGFYNPTNNLFPAQYTGKYFFGDFCGGWIRTFDPATKAIATFATGISSNVGLTVGNDGSLYYMSRGSGTGGTPSTGTVYKVSYATGQPPTLSAHPQDVLASAGEPASFSVQATGSSPFTYQWQRANGPTGTFANVAGATGATYTITSTTTGDNDARFRVLVTDVANRTTTSNAAVLSVTTNKRPVPVISTPTTGATFGGGQTITFSGGAFDPEEGTLPVGALTWRVDFHHADHVHPFLPDATGSANGSFTVPTVAHAAADVYYRITLTARDGGGLTRSVSRDVQPRLTTVTVDTDVPGLRVLVGDQPMPAPHVFTGIEGVHYDIEAPVTQFGVGSVWEFDGWSDGGARAHAFVTPVDDVTVRASYREVESAGFAIEGEAATFQAPMAAGSATGTSGGQYGGSPSANAATVDNPDTAGGRATYNFAVPADGVYAVFARGLAPGEFDDSFWFRIDNGAWWLWDMPNNPNWTWDQVGNRQPGGGPAPGSATFANLTAGNHTITLRIREDGARVDQFLITRDTAFVPAAGLIVDANPPRVEQVYVAGTAWTTGYRNSLGGIGHAIGAGSAANQLATLPWTNLNQVKVKFTESMNATSVQAAAASVLGVRKANYALVFSGYDAATRVATWTLANNARFGADRVRVVLPHTITDAGGARLDGNWTTGQSYASGNRAAGGAFDFTFNVLPGDITRDRAVSVFDMNIIRVNMNRTGVGVFGGDVNGDGVVNFTDYNEFRTYLGQTLPA